mmetsp:Transcript_11887/g.21581  ORF Transcript_11887/g.21581 Transcript_11887/m.21581 type:complete len:82 (+) Transcript_11887:662-907(+)
MAHRLLLTVTPLRLKAVNFVHYPTGTWTCSGCMVMDGSCQTEIGIGQARSQIATGPRSVKNQSTRNQVVAISLVSAPWSGV